MGWIPPGSLVWELADRKAANLTVKLLAQAVSAGDEEAMNALSGTLRSLAEALCHVIALLCPRRHRRGRRSGRSSERISSLLHSANLVLHFVFEPFRGLTDIVPAALGEEVVVHGRIALARKKLV